VFTDPGTSDDVYASHPPLIYSETALAETIAGERPVATRAPAYLASLVSILLLYLLLCRLGARPLVAATAAAVTLICPMFFVYGAMLDTPITGLPFALVVLLLLTYGEATDVRSRLVRAGAAAAAVLASWPAATVAGLVAVISFLRRPRHAHKDPFVLGFLGGLVVLAAWLLWAHGSFSTTVDDLRHRTGGASLTSSLTQQGHYLRSLMSPVALILGVPGLVVALARGQRRIVTVVVVGAAVIFAVALRGLMHDHEYWSYWVLVPLAIGTASSLGWLDERVRAVGPGRRSFAMVVPAAVAGVALLALVVEVRHPPAVARTIERQAEAGVVAQHDHPLSSQQWAWYRDVGAPPYLVYYTHLPERELIDGVDAPGDETVFVAREDPSGVNGLWHTLEVEHLVDPRASYGVVTVAQVWEALARRIQ
jgi:hypothetical protein